jgi:hypothetical protein
MTTSVFEMSPAQEHRVVEARGMSDVVRDPDAGVNFTEDEVKSFHRDDAMTAGMIAAILGIAFMVLLGQVISVTVWTAMVAG